jgi:ferrous iron transport protein B
VASRGEGLGTLVDVISTHIHNNTPAPKRADLGITLNSALQKIQGCLAQHHTPGTSPLYATAILEGDAAVIARYDTATRKQLETIVTETGGALGNSVSDELINARFDWISRITAQAVRRDQHNHRSLTDMIDSVLLNRVLALPIFLGVMYLMFMLTINVGGAFIDFFDQTAGALLVETPRQWFNSVGLPGWLVALLTDGLGGGLQLVASFIPVIGSLFLFQSFLEDSGYMARVAFILDRLMRSIGLPGKSFVPLIVGFGCNVPAIMATRTLESPQDRLMTSIMAPFMSCGARLTVYTLFAAAFFPTNGQNVVFGLYIIGIALAVLSGLLVRRRLMASAVTPFLMELPNYHIPTLRGLLIHTWHRLKGFMLRAGKAIVLVVIVLNFVNSLGTDGSFGNNDSEKSVLSVIGKSITPIFSPMGVKEENWPATVGIFSGIFAKEVVVGTLDALYSAMARDANGPPDDAPPPALWDQLKDAAATVPANLAELADLLGDPLGIGVGDLSDHAGAAEAQEVEVSTLDMMARLFDGQLGAFAYLLFVLLYVPCVATLGVLYKEAGAFWAFFSASWNTLIAYTLAVIVYQTGRFGDHPASSAVWIGSMSLILVAGCAVLIKLGRREIHDKNLIPALNID